MANLTQLEGSLHDVFVKNAPALPKGGKDFLVKFVPILTLIGGLLALWAAWNIWHWVNYSSTYINSLNAIYGDTVIPANHWSLALWIGVIVLLVEAVMYIVAYPRLRDRKKSGWDLLFYVALINVVYGVILLFTRYGGFGSFIGSLIGSAIGLYFLFQIRDRYTAVASARPANKSDETPKA